MKAVTHALFCLIELDVGYLQCKITTQTMISDDMLKQYKMNRKHMQALTLREPIKNNK